MIRLMAVLSLSLLLSCLIAAVASADGGFNY